VKRFFARPKPAVTWKSGASAPRKAPEMTGFQPQWSYFDPRKTFILFVLTDAWPLITPS
jgi:hypothetical protein